MLILFLSYFMPYFVLFWIYSNNYFRGTWKHIYHKVNYLSFGEFMKQITGDLRSSGMLCGLDCWLFTDVSGQPIGPISRGQAV
jgi:hypothetical protein